jgi:hypothetical protein
MSTVSFDYSQGYVIVLIVGINLTFLYKFWIIDFHCIENE